MTICHKYLINISIVILLHVYIGLLPAVGFLTATPIPLASIISLTWIPPFSLDIPHVDPDITGYSVGVVNSTSSLVIHSQCGITDTHYHWTRSSPLPGHLPSPWIYLV